MTKKVSEKEVLSSTPCCAGCSCKTAGVCKCTPKKSKGKKVAGVVLTAGLLAGGFTAAKKLGLLGSDSDDDL